MKAQYAVGLEQQQLLVGHPSASGHANVNLNNGNVNDNNDNNNYVALEVL